MEYKCICTSHGWNCAESVHILAWVISLAVLYQGLCVVISGLVYGYTVYTKSYKPREPKWLP